MTIRKPPIATFKKYDRTVLPVIDSKDVLVGAVTVDDVLDVAEREATEDIQKLGGMQALEAPVSWHQARRNGPQTRALAGGFVPE